MRQAKFSSSTEFFKDRIISRFNLVDYHSETDPVIMFGMYKDKDYDFFKKHKGEITVVWRGSDALKITMPRLKILRKKARHIAISEYIKKELKRYGIKSKIIPISGTTPLQNPKPLGECIYHYGKGETYKESWLEEIERRTGLKIIKADKNTFTKEQLNKIYERCFIGLRLTDHDGLPNTVLELGLMGRRSIYNGGIPHSIPWKNLNDVCQSVLKEYKNRSNKDADKISKDVKDYINIGAEWLKN